METLFSNSILIWFLTIAILILLPRILIYGFILYMVIVFFLSVTIASWFKKDRKGEIALRIVNFLLPQGKQAYYLGYFTANLITAIQKDWLPRLVFGKHTGEIAIKYSQRFTKNSLHYLAAFGLGLSGRKFDIDEIIDYEKSPFLSKPQTDSNSQNQKSSESIISDKDKG